MSDRQRDGIVRGINCELLAGWSLERQLWTRRANLFRKVLGDALGRQAGSTVDISRYGS